MANRMPFVIREVWRRPDASTVARFQGLPTALIADALDGIGLVDRVIRPVWDGPNFVGPALPVATAPHDNLAIHVAARYAQPGDVMAVSTSGSVTAGILGGVTTGLLGNAGIVGAVTDGVVRDVHEIAENGLPVHARGRCPGLPFNRGPGRIGLPISLGSAAVGAGDLIAADGDGIVVVPHVILEDVIDRLDAANAADRNLKAVIDTGTTRPPWADEALESIGVRIVE